MTAPGVAWQPRNIVASLCAVMLVIGGLLWQDRQSIERGNRLYHRGDFPSAAGVYGARVAADTKPGAATSYNLGTALITLDPVEAGHRLGLAVDGADSTAMQHAYYNLGYLFLTSIDATVEPRSAIPVLAAAVGSNRAALRLDPTDENARWNLALAQRMLDSLRAKVGDSPDNSKSEEGEKRQGEPKEEADGEPSASSAEAKGGAARDANSPQPVSGSGQRESVVGGESEAKAGQDPGPLTRAAALRLVNGIIDSPEQLIRGLLWSHRPTVAWWKNEPFPGGNW